MFTVMVSSSPVRASALGSIAAVLAIAAALSAVACAPSVASPKTIVDRVVPVEPAPEAAPGEPARPESDLEPIGIAIADSDLVEGKATVIVRAPIAKVRASILDFESYPHYMPEYSDAKHVGKLANGNDRVYMEVTTLGGIVKMFANVEILAVVRDGPYETYRARFLDGNVRNFKAIWTLKEVDEGRTDLSLQVFLHPAISLPDFIINKGNLDGAKKGVLAMKRHILENL